MIVRREYGGVGQGIVFAVACKTRVAGDCLQALMTEWSRWRRRRQLWAGAPPAWFIYCNKNIGGEP